MEMKLLMPHTQSIDRELRNLNSCLYFQLQFRMKFFFIMIGCCDSFCIKNQKPTPNLNK